MATYTPEEIQKVWEKATIVDGHDASIWRQDQCTAWIKRDEYGNRQSKFGWEIDHIIPVSKEGNDNLSNLRPLHWQNNASRQDGRLSCIIIAKK